MAVKKLVLNSITVYQRDVITGIGSSRACIVEPKIQNRLF